MRNSYPFKIVFLSCSLGLLDEKKENELEEGKPFRPFFGASSASSEYRRRFSRTKSVISSSLTVSCSSSNVEYSTVSEKVSSCESVRLNK